MPFSRGKNKVFCVLKKQRKERKKQNKKKQKLINKEGLGPSEVAFGPPPLTLKPSKKTKNKKQKKNK